MKRFLILMMVIPAGSLFAQNAVHPDASNPCDPKVLPVLWQQTSAEYRALCYQAFNLATLRIKEIPEKQCREGNLAIITDIDETILDNSYGEAQNILEHHEYSQNNWREWVKQQAAPPLAGSLEFMQYVHTKGISVFYISNRDTGEVRWTVENLKQLGFPDADTSHMLFMKKVSSKKQRRDQVMNKYTVVMLLGDNLNDFTELFEKRNIADRKMESDKLKDEWGRKFIVLPNSTYGEWENALYNYKHRLTTEQKDSIRMSLLKGYRDLSTGK
jgi:5'-nucleotidase (lipoprotein e(P4) family)